MKKRINDSEIEKAKSSTRAINIIISLCILLLIIIIAYIVFLYEQGKILKTEDGQYIINEEKDTKLIKKGLVIDSNNTNVIELWNYIKISNNSCIDGSYTDKNSINVSNLSETCKYSLASNIYNRYAINDKEKMIVYIKEEDVKNAYEKLFELGSYKKQNTIPYTNMDEMIYNIDNKYYFANGDFKEIDDTLKIYEKVTSIKKDNKDLYITSTALFYEQINNFICKDINCEKVLLELKKEKEYSDEYFDLYLDSKKDELSKYVYHFKQDNAGFYKYIGYEKNR